MAEEAIRETYISVYSPIVVEGRALLAYNRQGPYRGTWGLPGGGIEFGETPYEAIRRELWEEVGVRIETPTLYDVHSHRTLFERETGLWVNFHHIALLYQVSLISALPEQIVSPDANEKLVWHPLLVLDSLRLSPAAQYSLLTAAERR